MITDEEIKLVEEITDFINKNNVYLYIEVRDYALENKPEWLPIFRQKRFRRHFIEYTNSKRRGDKIKKNCFYEYLEKKTPQF